MKVAILYYQLLDADGESQLIGGVETYLLNLGELCAEMGWMPLLFQVANTAFRKQVGALIVIGVPLAHCKRKEQKRKLFDAACKEIDLNKDILIFGADHFSVPVQSPRCIAIQHGVSWDLPVRYTTSRKIARFKWAAKIKKRRTLEKARRNFENCPNTVCVDYNFLNWYRTIATEEPEGRVWVIPNFAPIASPEQIAERDYDKKKLRILFARRFEQYRGTRIMAQATERILRDNDNVMFALAGEGPDENWLRSRFSGESRVSFTKYMPDETLHIHLEHDISVVPSLASEGTCLSVAEAMGAGCTVVATAVGGITNMIIDGYNGVLVVPNADSLYEGIASVIKRPEFRRQLGKRAYETALAGFSLDRWKRQWKRVLNTTKAL